MRDHPVIFSGPMILALIAAAKRQPGAKTQTRRLATSPLAKVQPGDRLWTRETAWYGPADVKPSKADEAIWSVTGRDLPRHLFEGKRQAPSIHMPQRFSRLTLIVKEVRLEPVQAISEEDAWAEGVCHAIENSRPGLSMGSLSQDMRRSIVTGYIGGAREAFHWLWDQLHHKEGERWEDNPQIAALTFDVVDDNISRLAA